MLLAGAEYIAEGDQCGRVVADGRQGGVRAVDLLAGAETGLAPVCIQPHAARTDQRQIGQPGTDQVGQLCFRVVELGRQRRKRHEAGPAVIRVQREITAQTGAGQQPVQPAVAIQVHQCHAVRLQRRHQRQRFPWSVGNGIATRLRIALRRAIAPVAAITVQHAGQALAVQVDQLVMRAFIQTRQGRKRLVAVSRPVGAERRIAEIQRRQRQRRATAVVGPVPGTDQLAAQRSFVMVEQQATNQHRCRAECRELVKHQHLAAQPQRAQLEAACIVGERVLPHRPAVRCCPRRRGHAIGAAFAIVEHQREQPDGRIALAPGVQRHTGHGIAVLELQRIALRGMVAQCLGAAQRHAIGILVPVLVADVFAGRRNRLFQQPADNAAGVGRVGDAGRHTLAGAVQLAVAAMHQPEIIAVVLALPAFDAIESAFDAWQVAGDGIALVQCQVTIGRDRDRIVVSGRDDQHLAVRAEKQVIVLVARHAEAGAATDFPRAGQRPAEPERAVAAAAAISKHGGRGMAAAGRHRQGEGQAGLACHADLAECLAHALDRAAALRQ